LKRNLGVPRRDRSRPQSVYRENQEGNRLRKKARNHITRNKPGGDVPSDPWNGERAEGRSVYPFWEENPINRVKRGGDTWSEGSEILSKGDSKGDAKGKKIEHVKQNLFAHASCQRGYSAKIGIQNVAPIVVGKKSWINSFKRPQAS